MYGNMRSDRFPRLLDYASAARRFEQTTPFKRGSRKGERPLAERKRKQLIIRQDGDSYAVRLYNTDIITYKPDGQVIVEQGGWNSSTTHETIGAILDTRVFTRDGKGWIVCQNGTYVLRTEGGNVLRRGSVSDSTHYGTGWHYENPVYPKVHRVNKSNLTNVRQRYAEFTEYALRMVKVLGEDCVHDESVCRDHDVHMWRDAQISNAMLDEDKRYEAWLAVLRVSDMLIRQKRGWRYSWNRGKNVLVDADIREAITCILKAVHKDEVFDVEEVRDGRVVVDRNKRFV